MYYLLRILRIIKNNVINGNLMQFNKLTKLIIYNHSKILYSRVKFYFLKKIPILTFLKYISNVI